MKKSDYIFIMVIVLVAGIWYLTYHIFVSAPGAFAVVYQDGTEVGRYLLSKDTRVVLTCNGRGNNILEIKDGYADITEADCRDELCVRQKKISKNGESLVCLPHKLLVKVTGGTKNELDAVAQ